MLLVTIWDSTCQSWGIDLPLLFPLFECEDFVAKLMREKCKREFHLLHYEIHSKQWTKIQSLFRKWCIGSIYFVNYGLCCLLVNQTGEHKPSFVGKSSIVLDKALWRNKRWSHYFKGFIWFSVQAWLPAITLYVWLSRRTNLSKETSKSTNKIKSFSLQ